jgi:hypothetical protein
MGLVLTVIAFAGMQISGERLPCSDYRVGVAKLEERLRSGGNWVRWSG